MISDVTPYSLQGCAKEDVESLAYTIKEINAVTGLGLYTASVVCFPKTVPLVQEVWTKAFVNTVNLYITNASLPRSRQSKSSRGTFPLPSK